MKLNIQILTRLLEAAARRQTFDRVALASVNRRSENVVIHPIIVAEIWFRAQSRRIPLALVPPSRAAQ
jgi:hypothetical protein